MSEPGASSGYDPMPAAAPLGPVTRGPAPAPITAAVRAMLVRAALGLIALFLVFATKSSMRDQIAKRSPSLTKAQIDTAVTVGVAFVVILGTVFIVLYVVLALQVAKGKNWARITTFVLAGLGVLGTVLSLLQPAPVLSRLVSLITGVLDIAIIVLLARRPSGEYFRGTVR